MAVEGGVEFGEVVVVDRVLGRFRVAVSGTWIGELLVETVDGSALVSEWMDISGELFVAEFEVVAWGVGVCVFMAGC